MDLSIFKMIIKYFIYIGTCRFKWEK